MTLVARDCSGASLSRPRSLDAIKSPSRSQSGVRRSLMLSQGMASLTLYLLFRYSRRHSTERCAACTSRRLPDAKSLWPCWFHRLRTPPTDSRSVPPYQSRRGGRPRATPLRSSERPRRGHAMGQDQGSGRQDCAVAEPLKHLTTFDGLSGLDWRHHPRSVKTAVIGEDADGLVIYNRGVLDLARYYGFQPKACRPYRPKTKGKVAVPLPRGLLPRRRIPQSR